MPHFAYAAGALALGLLILLIWRKPAWELGEGARWTVIFAITSGLFLAALAIYLSTRGGLAQ